MTDDATQRARNTLARLRCWRQLYSTAMPIDDPDVSTIAGAIREAEARGRARAIEAAARVAEHHPYREGAGPGCEDAEGCCEEIAGDIRALAAEQPAEGERDD
jgi:hypothetical protein